MDYMAIKVMKSSMKRIVLKTIITNHVLEESIPKRNLTNLMELGKEKCKEFLMARLPLAEIINPNSKLYETLERGMPEKFRGTGLRYYKLDSFQDIYPYIYVAEIVPIKLIEKLMSIYHTETFGKFFSFKLKDMISSKQIEQLKRIRMNI